MKITMTRFPGFPPIKGNCWQYPRDMDLWWHPLSGSEQKCLDYILRRTFGFDKNFDSISLSQFKNGIMKKDGEVLDYGTGLDKVTTLTALKALEEKGFIRIIKATGTTNKYELVMRG